MNKLPSTCWSYVWQFGSAAPNGGYGRFAVESLGRIPPAGKGGYHSHSESGFGTVYIIIKENNQSFYIGTEAFRSCFFCIFLGIFNKTSFFVPRTFARGGRTLKVASAPCFPAKNPVFFAKVPFFSLKALTSPRKCGKNPTKYFQKWKKTLTFLVFRRIVNAIFNKVEEENL